MISSRKPEISGYEVCEILRDAIPGHLTAKLGRHSVTLDPVYIGIVPFLFDDLQIILFNDSDELDSCKVRIASDGRSEVFMTWDRTSEEPMSLAAHGIDPSPFHSMENLIGNTA
ncbi:DUF7693 family protein [Pseudomonas fragi]